MRRQGWQAAACFVAFGLITAARASDWPQWRGPERTGVSQEKGLLKSWPAGGPKLLWKVGGLGGGYGPVSVASGRLYGMGYVGNREVVWCREVATGREIWKTPIAQANRRGKGYDDGPRCAPTVDGARLYALGDSGDFACLTTDGKVVWQKDLVTDFGGEVPGWGYSESPLVDGEKVIITPGGRNTIVALNKATGAPHWRASVPGGNGAHYSSAIAADVSGHREIIQFLSGGVVGVDASSGRFLWRYNAPANGTANIATPIFFQNQVFAASNYNTGGGLVRLATSASGVTATEVYFTRQMQNHHGGMVLVGNYLYGANGSNLACLDIRNGAVKWENRSVGKSSLVYADGCLYVRSERGTVALVEANPNAYVERGRFDQPARTDKNAWAHPVVANGRFYLRDQDTLYCYDVKQ